MFCESQTFYNNQTTPFLILLNAYAFPRNDGLCSYPAARVSYWRPRSEPHVDCQWNRQYSPGVVRRHNCKWFRLVATLCSKACKFWQVGRIKTPVSPHIPRSHFKFTTFVVDFSGSRSNRDRKRILWALRSKTVMCYIWHAQLVHKVASLRDS
jgi:hypothetical protein